MALNQHLVYVYAWERKRLYGNRTLSWAQAVSDVALVFERVQECSQERILLVFRMEIMKLGIVGKTGKLILDQRLTVRCSFHSKLKKGFCRRLFSVTRVDFLRWRVHCSVAEAA